MATCKWCKESGWFFSVNKEGLCKSCQASVSLEVESRVKVINESIALIENSKKLETRISRCDVVISHLEDLLKYEKAGVSIIDPIPSVFLKNIRNLRNRVIIDGTLEVIQPYKFRKRKIFWL